jgi:hypothetical protein
MESGKYEREWYIDPSRRPPSSNPFLEGGLLLGNHDTHQGEIGKKRNFQANVFKIKKGSFATCSNASNIKMTLTTIPDLLPHAARAVVLYG